VFGEKGQRLQETSQTTTGVGAVDEEGSGPVDGRSEISAAGGHGSQTQGGRVRIDEA
jgi:hypothetical protein